MKTDILKQASELTIASQPDILTFSTEADVMFSNLSRCSSNMSEIMAKCMQLASPDPLACVATGRGTEEAVVGEKATAILNAVTFNGEPCDTVTASLSFQVDLVSEITGSKVIGGIEHSMEAQRTGAAYDQLPAHCQGEAPATHQS